MKIHDSHIFIDMKISKLGLIRLFTQFLEKWPEKTIKFDGYEIKIKQAKEQDFSMAVQGKTIKIGIPIIFEFLKRAGLFSIEGEGHIHADLSIDYEIKQDFSLHTSTSLTGHRWIGSLTLKLGVLDIPISTLGNIIMMYVKEKILDKADNYLSNSINIKQLIADQVKRYGYNYPVSQNPALYFNISIAQILAGKIIEDNLDIHIDLWVDLSTTITDLPQQNAPQIEPQFFWIDDLPHTHSLNTAIELSYLGLARLIMQSLNGTDIGGKTFEIESVHIRNTSFMQIIAYIREPVKGIVTITGQPYFDHADRLVHVKGLKVELEAKNIIYKISSPIIEKIISNKLEALFPYNIAPFFLKYFNDLPAFTFFDNKMTLRPEISRSTLHSVHFLEEQIAIIIHLENAEIGVTLMA